MFRKNNPMSASMKIVLIFFFIILHLNPVHAQETINEGQLLLNGYVDISGKVLLTGYASPGSLTEMPFLNGTNYTFENKTNQLYAVTDSLTSKNESIWSLNFSLEGYYSDYSIIFYLPPGSEVTKFEIPPELNYQFQVKEDSLALSIQGNKVIAPWIKVDYKLPADIPAPSKSLFDPVISLIIILISGATFIFYRYGRTVINKEKVISEDKRSSDRETRSVIERIEIPITSEMQKVIDTLSDKEKSIVSILLKKGGSATQADIRYETRIPKSSLTGIINALKRKNIIKKYEQGRTNLIEFSKWFLSEKEPK
jgi:uncharacterized membrane protein